MDEAVASREHHPWRYLVHAIRFADLGDRMGAWDPETGTIWLSHGLTQVERRCTLVHEQIHAERGDEPCVSEWHERRQERTVEEEAARRLIPHERLAHALLWSLDEDELAEDLWVDVDTVRARLSTLTDSEKDDIGCRLQAAERDIA